MNKGNPNTTTEKIVDATEFAMTLKRRDIVSIKGDDTGAIVRLCLDRSVSSCKECKFGKRGCISSLSKER